MTSALVNKSANNKNVWILVGLVGAVTALVVLAVVLLSPSRQLPDTAMGDSRDSEPSKISPNQVDRSSHSLVDRIAHTLPSTTVFFVWSASLDDLFDLAQHAGLSDKVLRSIIGRWEYEQISKTFGF